MNILLFFFVCHYAPRSASALSCRSPYLWFSVMCGVDLIPIITYWVQPGCCLHITFNLIDVSILNVLFLFAIFEHPRSMRYTKGIMPITTFHEAESYLATLAPTPQFTGEKRLQYIRRVLGDLGSPQDQIPMIHVAGTSGKGSTAYYASQLLSESGYTVGLVMSPHVSCVAERTQINSQLLPEDEYCRYLESFIEVITTIDTELTYVEFLNIFSYWLFAKIGVDYMVVEVGIGGRLDTTNVTSRVDKVAVITDIGLDHTDLLGDTLPKIAQEKAGIIRAGGSVVMHSQAPEVMQVVRQAASDKGAEFIEVGEDLVTSAPLPSYQIRNGSLALAAVNRRLAIDNKPPVTIAVVDRAFGHVVPGRFERIEVNGVPTLLDGAHNPQKIQAFAEAYRLAYPETPCIIVAAFGKNKTDSVDQSFSILRTLSSHLIVTEFTVEGAGTKGSLDCTMLSGVAQEAGFGDVITENNPHAALAQATEWAHAQDGMVIVTGSFYLVSMLR